MQSTPRGNRLHIGIFGRRNAGKSSLINSLTKQEAALVSPIAGTTTDPVYKAMEILPIGPVMIIDTAGIDDSGTLGEMRIEKTKEVITKTDVAILVMDGQEKFSDYEENLIEELKKRKISTILVLNKEDVLPISDEKVKELKAKLKIPVLKVSTVSLQGIEHLKEQLIKSVPDHWDGQPLVGDLINGGDSVVMVVPIDTAAPKGRLILPQVQAIRDVLDHDGHALVVKERELKSLLDNLKEKPKLVITDSQEFLKVEADTPKEIKLTSFSILMARHKGNLETLVMGAKAIDSLKRGDKVLIAEACTHQCQSDDIGRVKIPRWLRQYVGGELEFHWVSGNSFPVDLQKYKLIIHCGGCMINRRAMLHRIQVAEDHKVPIVNYGVLIAKLHGILPRALSPFPYLQMLIEEE
ncbi:MAG: mnmE 2 [Massilibacillus sp.]|jgi:[FeFe] hydrogenase H-cluster maturation GTPase HydF|nr:mnmE 2 [Massilibacillus sp.]